MGKKQPVLVGRQFKYIKAGMYTLNALVGVLGLALGGVGIWIRVDFKASMYNEILSPVFQLCEEEDANFDFRLKIHMDSVAYFLIFLGVAILGTGCMGIRGALRERTTLLILFSMLLFILFAILFAAGIQTIVKKDSFVKCESKLAGRLSIAAKEYFVNDQYRKFMDDVHRHVGCCGATQGKVDFDSAFLSQYSHPCNDTSKLEPCDRAIKGFFYAISDNMIIIMVVSFCIAIFTLIGIGMASYLFVSLRNVKRKS